MPASETIEARGHLIDSGHLSAIFDKVIELNGQYEVVRFDIGLGDRIQPRVLPTNVVCVYAPRFAEVRVTTGTNETIEVQGPRAGITVESDALLEAAEESGRRIDELIAVNPEHVELVRRLEEQVDAETAQMSGFGPIPSGDEIAAELERFLRDER